MRNDALVIEEIQTSMEKNEPREKKCIDFRSDQKYNMTKILVEYAETHNLSISQLIRMGVELQMKQQANQ